MQSSGVAVGGTALSFSDKSRIQSGPVKHKAVSGKVKIGIIGVGQRARREIEWLERFSHECEIVAVCDIEQGQIDKTLQGMKISKPKVYYDWRQMIEHPGLDAVSIQTPIFLHHDMMLGCLDKRLHIMIAKPMAMNPVECAGIVRKWRYSGVTVIECLQNMYSQRTKFVKDLIDSGEIGNVKFIHWNEFRRDWAWKGTNPDLEHELNWMYMKTLMGDGLVADSCYYYEQCQHFIGAKPTTAVALGGIHVYHDRRNTMDHCGTLVQYDNGAMLSHNMLLYSRGSRGGYIVVGDKAQIRFLPAGRNETGLDWYPTVDGALSLEPRDYAEPIQTIDLPPSENNFSVDGNHVMAGEYREFFDCVRTGRLPLTNPMTAADAVLVAYACQQSAYQGGQVVHIKDIDPGAV